MKIIGLFRTSLAIATMAIFLLLNVVSAVAQNRVVDLTIGYKTVDFAGKSIQAMAINNQIPGPTLRFKEGDHVTINVHNQLHTGTAIHWHGLLLPWQMDGVDGVTQYPIAPGGVFHYQFTLKQSGTYWYHSHAGLQEQAGVYGAFIIDPAHPVNYHYNQDYPMVLSDWSNTNAKQIYANLKKDGDYYSTTFPLQPSLMRFIHDYTKATPVEKTALSADYKMMQQMRMSLYDISDVGYDTFLLNGQPPTHPWTAVVKVGDIVRLRFIGANAGTISHIKIPGAHMQMVNAQGHDIRPYWVDDLSVAPGETYDVLVRIEKNTPYIIYAESADTAGAAYGALLTAPQQVVNYQQVPPFPIPQSSSREMMGYMMQSGGQPMDLHGMKMPMHNMADQSMSMSHAMGVDDKNTMLMTNMPAMDNAISSAAPKHAMTSAKMQDAPATVTTSLGTKYQYMRSPVKTNNPTKPVTVIHMALYGYMGRFIWFINNLPEHQAKPIILEPGKRYRIIFANESMMHHPMHIHGHFFILRNGHGAYDPLLHTIDVPPGATMVVDFDADAGGGQWLFHCHLLYHMMAGMARVFQYSTLQQEVSRQPVMATSVDLIKHPMAHPTSWSQASWVDIGADLVNQVQKLNFKTLLGGDYHKLQLNMEDAETNTHTVENANLDVFYWQLIDEFWAVKAGANYVYRPAQTPYWQPGMGIEGLMPYFIDTDIRSYYHHGSGKVDMQFSRDTQITQRFFIRTSIGSILASKTVTADEVGSGLNQLRYRIRPFYRLTPQLALFFEYEHQDNYGAYASQLRAEEKTPQQNSYTLGLSCLF